MFSTTASVAAGTDPNDGCVLADAATSIDATLKQLRYLGCSDQAEGLLNDAAEQAQSHYAALDADSDHSESWKRQQYASRYIAVMGALSRNLAALVAGAAGQDKDDAARVYGVKGLPGDVASLTISRRHAQSAVEDISNPEELQRLLTRAARSGDDVLTRAIAEKAIQAGYQDVAEQFQTAYPDLAEAVSRLWAMEHGKVNAKSLHTFWLVAALKPRALASLQPYEIQAVADGQAAA